MNPNYICILRGYTTPFFVDGEHLINEDGVQANFSFYDEDKKYSADPNKDIIAIYQPYYNVGGCKLRDIYRREPKVPSFIAGDIVTFDCWDHSTQKFSIESFVILGSSRFKSIAHGAILNLNNFRVINGFTLDHSNEKIYAVAYISTHVIDKGYPALKRTFCNSAAKLSFLKSYAHEIF